MPESKFSNPKRRPVDALFGEEVDMATPPITPAPSSETRVPPATAPSASRQATSTNPPTPSYMVEPPRQTTVLRPPPPELPADWRSLMQSEAAAPISFATLETFTGDALAKPTKPETKAPPAKAQEMRAAMPSSAPPVSTSTAAESAPSVEEPQPVLSEAREATPERIQAVKPEELETHAAAPVQTDVATIPDEYGDLAPFIDALYEQATEEAVDSPLVSEQCLALLHAARAALLERNYALAEFNAEQAKARLLRARASNLAAEGFGVKLIWLWNVFAGAITVVLILLPFYTRLVPGFVPLMRAVSLAALGGVMVSLWNVTHKISNREYDPAYNAEYVLGPIKGALIGGIIFFLSALGLVAAPRALAAPTFYGGLSTANLLLYFVALLAGIAQDYIFEFVRGVLAAVFRAPGRSTATQTSPGR